MIGRKVQLLSRSTILAIVLALTVIGVAFAITPTVDGDDTGDWGASQTTCNIGDADCSRILDDDQDVTGPAADYYDVQYVYSTNDGTYMYFRLDFWGNGTSTANTWLRTSAFRPLLNICLDIDNNTGTGQTLVNGNCDGDESMTGVDYRIEVVGRSTGLPRDPNVYECLTVDCDDLVTTGTVGYDSFTADSDTITEIRVTLASLGISGTCPDGGAEPCEYRIGLYYDNGVSSSDDSIPDSGFSTPTFGGGSPTAIVLKDITARSANQYAVPLLVGSLVLLAALLWTVRRVRGRVA